MTNCKPTDLPMEPLATIPRVEPSTEALATIDSARATPSGLPCLALNTKHLAASTACFLTSLKLIHQALGGEYSVLLITDDRSRYRWVVFTAKGYTVIPAWNAWLNERQRELPGLVIACIRIDNDPSWRPLAEELTKIGIKVEWTVPYHPQQNGVSERGVRTVTEHARATLYELSFALIERSGLPLEQWRFLWPEAIRYHAYVYTVRPPGQMKA